ncbi:MAG TPA: NAD-dependent isocitrate dehydrogenase [Deltaproteobacteria bacterium]|nr:NAD-dependent isocitrate dehydrogenase [Deltaproteobacteria bacterium]
MSTREVTAVYGDCPGTFQRVQLLLSRAGAELRWDEPSEGASHADMLRSAKRTGLALVGYRRSHGSGLPPAVLLRDELGVYAQHRPIRPLPGIPCRHDDVDLIVVRETTEDVYAHLEHESLPGVFESLKVTTEGACQRIARHAFEVARASGRPKVTVVHKANIMKLSDGMFLRVAREVAKDYPDIQCDDVIVDALCMKLVLQPGQFEVLLCGNLFGDIVADLCAGLVGGASNAPSINLAEHTILFTAGHGDPPEVDRTEAANPLPVLLPAIHLLRHIGQDGEAERIHDATAGALEAGVVPQALGGSASLEAFCAAVESRL